MKIYLAARFGDMMLMRPVRDRLVALGHEVTARWIDGGEAAVKGQEEGALMDMADVMAADTLVLFTQPLGSSNIGGGRHFEHGLAYAYGKRIFIIGEQETIFCYLPGAEVHASFDAAVDDGVFG